MTKASERITFTVTAELASQISEAAKADGCSRSAFIRQAVDKQIRDLRWEERYRYGTRKAKEMHIKPEDVMDNVHKVRDELWHEKKSRE